MVGGIRTTKINREFKSRHDNGGENVTFNINLPSFKLHRDYFISLNLSVIRHIYLLESDS